LRVGLRRGLRDFEEHLVRSIPVPFAGSWRNLGNQKQFVASGGGILNWWLTTGTIKFQGNPGVEAHA